MNENIWHHAEKKTAKRFPLDRISIVEEQSTKLDLSL